MADQHGHHLYAAGLGTLLPLRHAGSRAVEVLAVVSQDGQASTRRVRLTPQQAQRWPLPLSG